MQEKRDSKKVVLIIIYNAGLDMEAFEQVEPIVQAPLLASCIFAPAFHYLARSLTIH